MATAQLYFRQSNEVKRTLHYKNIRDGDLSIKFNCFAR